jgi:hypothetical protein
MRILVPLMVVAALATAQSAPSPLVGAWRVSEYTSTGPNAATNRTPQPGPYLFTEKYFSMVLIAGNNPRPDVDPAKATDAEIVASWRPFVAQSGTYEVSGTTLTIHLIVAKVTGRMHPDSYATFTFKRDGNTRTIAEIGSTSGPKSNPTTTKLTRVE